MKQKNPKNPVTSKQLLQFSDAIGEGKTFTEALLAAGVLASNEGAISELGAYAKVIGNLKKMSATITPPPAFADNIIATTTLTPVTPTISETLVSPPMKHEAVFTEFASEDRSVQAADWMVQAVAHPSMKIAAPIFVMLIVLSFVLNLDFRSSPPMTEVSLATPDRSVGTMMVLVADQNSDQLRSTENPRSGTEAVTMMMATKSAAPTAGQSDTSSNNADDIVATLFEESDSEANENVGDNANTASYASQDSESMNDLQQPYDESAL